MQTCESIRMKRKVEILEHLDWDREERLKEFAAENENNKHIPSSNHTKEFFIF